MRSTHVKFLHYSAEETTFYREKLKITLIFQTYQLCMVAIFFFFFNTKFEDRSIVDYLD